MGGPFFSPRGRGGQGRLFTGARDRPARGRKPFVEIPVAIGVAQGRLEKAGVTLFPCVFEEDGGVVDEEMEFRLTDVGGWLLGDGRVFSRKVGAGDDEQFEEGEGGSVAPASCRWMHGQDARVTFRPAPFPH